MIDLTAALALPLAKLLLKSWLGDTAAAVGDNLFKLGLKTLGDKAKARAAEERANTIARAVVQHAQTFFVRERVDEDTLVAAAYELRDMIDTNVDAAFLVHKGLDPEEIRRGLLEARPVGEIDPPERELYTQLIGLLAPRLRAVAPELPDYELERDEQLLRMKAVVDSIGALLADLKATAERAAAFAQEAAERPQKLAEGYEEDYLRALVSELNRVDLIGLTVDEPARGAELEVAYLSLRTRLGFENQTHTLDFATLLTLLPKLGNRVLIEGPAGSGKTTLLRWAGIQAARFRLGEAGSDPLALLPDLDSWLARLTVRDAKRSGHAGLEEVPGRFEGRDDPREALREQLDEAAWQRRVPFFVPLRRVKGELTPEALPRIAKTVRSRPGEWLGEVAPAALILIDGVDEVPAGRERDEALRTIETWAAERFPEAPILVTSRPGAVGEHALGSFMRVQLDELDDEQKSEFIDHWHRGLAAKLKWPMDHVVIRGLADGVRHELEHQGTLNDLAANPLLAASLSALHWDRRRDVASAAHRDQATTFVPGPPILPGSRWRVCEALVEMLLERREAESVDFDAADFPVAYQLTFEQKRTALSRIAWGMAEDRMRSTMARAAAEQRVTQALTEMRAPIDAPPAEVLKALIERSGVLRAAGEDGVEFLHNTLRAFLAAQRYLTLGEASTLINTLVAAQPEQIASGLDEVAVFCAASATGQAFAADQMRRLLAEASEIERRDDQDRARGLRILAVRCEASAGTDIGDDVRGPVRAIAPGLFPPQTMEEARQLAALGDEAVGQLGRREGMSEDDEAASVRCLRLIASEKSKTALDSYSSTETPAALEELSRIRNPLTLPAVLAAAQDIERWNGLPDGVKERVADLAPLAGLHALKHLSLDRPRVADEQIAALIRALPEVMISR